MKPYHTSTYEPGLFSFSFDNQLLKWVGRNWFNAILLYLAGQLLFQRNLSLQVNLEGERGEKFIAAPLGTRSSLLGAASQQATFVPPVNVSQLVKKSLPQAIQTSMTSNKEPTFSTSNLTPALGESAGTTGALEKEQAMQAYVEKYASAAVRAMQNYDIPASITLAQGLLESNAGASVLARESNNHFGIKCRRKCRGCTCRNYTDDDVYDMFRVFDSVWESYEEHSVLLSSPRYKHLKTYGKDYKSWAYGLKRAGYATDKQYAQKLIRLIRKLKLDRYDQ